MPKRNKDLELLILLPWWLILIFGTLAYGTARFIVPTLNIQNPFFKGFAQALPQFAAPILYLFIFFAAISAIHAWRKRFILNSQTGVDSIKSLSWKDFEYLVSEAFSRQGFLVEENLSAGADGGVDLVLRKEGRKYLVQCKNWRKQSIGVSPIRELYGLIMADKAAGGFFVCSGHYSKDAIEFARDKPLKLINGTDLAKMIGSAQKKAKIKVDDNIPHCPKCNGQMVLRTARKGNNIGNKFWGCSNFPRCRYTQPY